MISIYIFTLTNLLNFTFNFDIIFFLKMAGETKSWSQIVSSASTYISGTTFTIPATTTLNTSTDNTNLLFDKLGNAVTTIEWNGPIAKSGQNLISLDGMFYNCKNVSKITFGDAFNNSLKNNVYKMLGMFYGCSALTEIEGITKWDLSTVDTIARMFFGCSNLMSIDIHGWILKPGVNTSFVFANCFTEATTTSGKKGYIYATKTVMDALCGEENQAYSMNGSAVNDGITSIYRDDDIEDDITNAVYNKYTVSYTPLDPAISLNWVGYNSDL